MAQAGLRPLKATGITVLQLNVGKLCNQTCRALSRRRGTGPYGEHVS